MYDPDNPDEYLISENNVDPPSVIEDNGRYFVDGDGTHRLTVAKVLGGKKAGVVVKRKKNQT